MRLHFDFLDNSIEITRETIQNIECENKNYFYRIVSELNNISNGNIDNSIVCTSNNEEFDLSNRIQIYMDYFNFNFDNKKYQTRMLNLLQEKMDEESVIKLNNSISKVNKELSKKVGQIDLPVLFENITLEKIYKILKFDIERKDTLLENLFTIIDIEKTFYINKLTVFVNLKQYLSKEELNEFYKYAIYNEVKVLLVDSQAYGVANAYEKKLLIDNDLVEFML